MVNTKIKHFSFREVYWDRKVEPSGRAIFPESVPDIPRKCVNKQSITRDCFWHIGLDDLTDGAQMPDFGRFAQAQSSFWGIPARSHDVIDTVPQKSVIFVSSPRGIPSAVYGGLMTHRAKASNAAGTVVDGKFRDLDEQRALNWPVIEMLDSLAAAEARIEVDIAKGGQFAESSKKHRS
nr:protein dlpa [Quercus suber]